MYFYKKSAIALSSIGGIYLYKTGFFTTPYIIKIEEIDDDLLKNVKSMTKYNNVLIDKDTSFSIINGLEKPKNINIYMKSLGLTKLSEKSKIKFVETDALNKDYKYL